MEFARQQQYRKALNLTPLIDVVFLLVVFFMLTTSFAKTESMELTLPALGAGVVSGEAIVYVGILPGGKVTVGPERMVFQEMLAKLTDTIAQNPKTQIMLVATKSVSVQEVVTVMDSINAIGAEHISISYYE